MSTISAQYYRTEKDILIKTKIEVSDMDSDVFSVQFRNSDGPIGIVSTNAGIISNDVVTIKGQKTAEIIIEKAKPGYDCLISFKNGNEIKHSESISFSIDNNNIVVLSATQPIKSEWKITLSIMEDFVCSIRTTSTKPIHACFGQIAENIEYTDFIFQIYPGQRKLIIPVEIFWANKMKYSSKTVSCFEVIKSAENIYRKKQISNSITFDKVLKRDKKPLYYFVDPVGKTFDAETWEITQSGLPTKKI